jgi:TFIIIC subunit triple barrel domain
MVDVRVVLEVPRELSAEMSAGATYTIAGIDTDSPTLTVGETVLHGQFFDTVGTDLVFSEGGRMVGSSAKRLVFGNPPAPPGTARRAAAAKGSVAKKT